MKKYNQFPFLVPSKKKKEQRNIRALYQQHCKSKYVNWRCVSVPRFFGHTVFLKLRIGQFSDTPNPPNCCSWASKNMGKDMSLLKRFLFLRICELYLNLVFTWNTYVEKGLQQLVWVHFFWVPTPLKRYQNTSGCGTACFVKLDFH